MGNITLLWNSRTPEGIIARDENFKSIVDFIRKGKVDGGQWIINFYGYDKKESRAFQEKMIEMLKREITDKNFRWPEGEGERNLISGESQYSFEQLLQELNKIPGYKSGIVTLYEPIDFGYKISDHEDRKYSVHKAIAEIFKEKKLFLLLFGNIPYDIHHFKENSPLIKFVWKEYIIKEYGKDELRILRQLKETIDERILGYTDGNFGLVHELEAFWGEIKVEDRINDLLNNFLEIPLKTKLEKMVFEKLAALSGFLENNQDEIGNKIKYIDNEKKILILKEKSTELFKAYFDKAALFDSKEVTDQLQSKYELMPKSVFVRTVDDSNFIKNEGKIKKFPKLSETLNEDFDQIASYFENKRPIFILGAGNSLTSGAPDRKKFFKEILIQIFPQKKDEYEIANYDKLKDSFQKLIYKHPQDDIRKRVIKLLSDLKPSIGHFYLTQLMKSAKLKIKVLITTNFDTLLEDSLMDYGIRSKDFIKMVSRKNINDHEWDWVNEFPDHLKILKICGDMYYGSWLAVDDDAASNWIDGTLKTVANLEDFRRSNLFIILGHKFEEIDLSKIFEGKSKQNLTVVYANPDERDCQDFDKKYRPKCIIKSISGELGKFDNFMEALCPLLKKKKLV